MAKTQPSGPESRNLVSKLYHWFVDGLDRTVWMGIQYTFPKRFVSPLAFLGVLTGITFLVLGVTGGILMIYYQPAIAGCTSPICAFQSVQSINDSIPYGYMLRNIHYTASNAMVLLAVLHLYYNYFSGRFKIKNEILWVTGVILGIITGGEAYTGYGLLLNQRAGLALDIGISLTNGFPVIGSQLLQATLTSDFADLILRLYSLHVFILPMIMVILVFIHFPRYLVFDLPVISTVVGALLLIAGVFPVSLGTPFTSGAGSITIPEWYVDALYALLRTGFDKIVMGAVVPSLLFLMAIVVPFVDTSKKLNWRDRPFFAALGVTSIAQILITTAWGFYVEPQNAAGTLTPYQRIFIPPALYFGSIVGVTALSFVMTYAFMRYIRGRERVRKAVAPLTPLLSRRWVYVIFMVLILAQVALNGLAVSAINQGLRSMSLFDAGAVLVTFGVIVHLYRYSQSLPF